MIRFMKEGVEMKIDYVSDVHADFWVNFVPNQQKWESRTKDFAFSLIPKEKGELLIVAGDFSNINRQSKWLFEVWSQEYEKIFVVFGNHDYYLDSKNMMKKYKSSINRINEMIAFFDEVANVTVLERFQVVEHKGFRFAGDTAWYPVKSQEEKHFFNHVTNDSLLIRGFYIPDAYDVHQEAYRAFTGADVIVTHVPPIHVVAHQHKNPEGYVSPFDSYKAPIWIAGHAHARGSEPLGDGMLYSHCLGYPENKKEVAPTFEQLIL